MGHCGNSVLGGLAWVRFFKSKIATRLTRDDCVARPPIGDFRCILQIATIAALLTAVQSFVCNCASCREGTARLSKISVFNDRKECGRLLGESRPAVDISIAYKTIKLSPRFFHSEERAVSPHAPIPHVPRRAHSARRYADRANGLWPRALAGLRRHSVASMLPRCGRGRESSRKQAYVAAIGASLPASTRKDASKPHTASVQQRKRFFRCPPLLESKTRLSMANS